jgi:hypothetical protein
MTQVTRGSMCLPKGNPFETMGFLDDVAKRIFSQEIEKRRPIDELDTVTVQVMAANAYWAAGILLDARGKFLSESPHLI